MADTLIFFCLCDIWGIHEIISNVLSYLIAATGSYFLNSTFVYREEKYSILKYLKFLTANTSVLVISTVSLALLSKYVAVKTVAKLITIPISVALNFVLQRFVVFKSGAQKQIEEK